MRSATRRKVGKDRAYLIWLKDQPCCVCNLALERAIELVGLPFTRIQRSRTEAAHVGDRGLSQKCPDREAIPLCGVEHHREGAFSAHKLQKKFWFVHGLDRDELIAKYNAAFELRSEAA